MKIMVIHLSTYHQTKGRWFQNNQEEEKVLDKVSTLKMIKMRFNIRKNKE